MVGENGVVFICLLLLANPASVLPFYYSALQCCFALQNMLSIVDIVRDVSGDPVHALAGMAAFIYYAYQQHTGSLAEHRHSMNPELKI